MQHHATVAALLYSHLSYTRVCGPSTNFTSTSASSPCALVHCYTAWLTSHLHTGSVNAWHEILSCTENLLCMQAHLDHNQQLVHRLQQQLSDAMAQQQMLRSSFQQIEAVSDTGRAAKAEAR